MFLGEDSNSHTCIIILTFIFHCQPMKRAISHKICDNQTRRKKRMFAHNSANWLGNYERYSFFGTYNNNQWLMLKFSNKYQNHKSPWTLNLIPISYALVNKENGRREWCQNRAVRKIPPRPTGANGRDDGNFKNIGESKRDKQQAQALKIKPLITSKEERKHLPNRAYSPTLSSDPCNATHASKGSIPIRLCTTPSTSKWNGAEFRG